MENNALSTKPSKGFLTLSRLDSEDWGKQSLRPVAIVRQCLDNAQDYSKTREIGIISFFFKRELL